MKNSIYSLLLIPIVYAGFMLYKTPTLPDAIILWALSSLTGFLVYINYKSSSEVTEKSEISELEEELRIERLKLSIEGVRENAAKEKLIRDSRAAVTGQAGKKLIF